MRAMLVLVTAALVLISHGGARVTARDRPTDTDVFPQLKVSLTGAFGRGGAAGSLVLLRDTWTEVTLYAGERTSPGTTVCVGGAMSAAPGARTGVPRDTDPAVSWTVSARLIDYRAGTAIVDLRWQRTPMASGLEPTMARDARVRWTAQEGGTTVLDAVHALDPEDAACASTSVTAEFVIGSAFEFIDAAIAYDAWLVQRLPSGQTRTHHVRTSAQQGEAVSVMFPALGIGTADGTGAPLRLKVHGQVRGRLRTDGTIEVTVDMSRFVLVHHGGIGTGGRSHLRMALGETVEFAAVPLVGTLAGQDLASTFKDLPTAIRIRATRLW